MTDIIERPSSHCEERKNGAIPSFLIIHYTETKNAEEAEDYFLGRKSHPGGGRVSAHYMIDEDGSAIRYVDEALRAWHAGVSYWSGIEDINSHSIGIELVNPGRIYGYHAFPVRQMAALVQLSKDILSRHPAITPLHVLAHSDIAPTRKSDPGELFDWEMMAKAGIGVFPAPEEDDYAQGKSLLSDPQVLKNAFAQMGYDPKASLEDIIIAFHRHYHRRIFGDQNKEAPHRMNEESAARLHWLVRTKGTETKQGKPC